jgi:hypothetical protein
MRNKAVKYNAGEIGRVKVIEDFLRSPDALVAREDNVKVRSASPAAASNTSSARPSRAACPISA